MDIIPRRKKNQECLKKITKMRHASSNPLRRFELTAVAKSIKTPCPFIDLTVYFMDGCRRISSHTEPVRIRYADSHCWAVAQ